MNIFKSVTKTLIIIISCFVLFVLFLQSYDLKSTSFLVFSIIAALLIILIVYLYLRSMFNPVEKIFNQLDKLAKGELQELPELTKAEFTRSFRDLNIITERLQKYKSKLSKQKEGFNVIIETIKEAIWVQNKKGLIRTYNTSFAEMVKKGDIKNQYFWNVITRQELYDLADQIFKNPVSSTKEINFENNHFLCSTSYSPLTEETVFILYDITEFRKLETIKKDFVLNVSHELRTPLTSIKGYLETMEDGLTEEQHSYIDVIKRNADRLVNIVNDLLTLSRLEHLQDLEIENIVIFDFLKSIANIFKFKLQKKNIELVIDIDTEDTIFQADRYKFEQVIINLIDNAIKYTDAGQIKILVSKDEMNYVFKITDSGFGIQPEHLPRLFERFYVIDKSRSRRMGGTGLGLSIVKHIVNLHNGSIKVESKVGMGTKFIVEIPKFS
ncbi:ATP-binding protein [Candidatus Cloacimonadota bacterium]